MPKSVQRNKFKMSDVDGAKQYFVIYVRKDIIIIKIAANRYNMSNCPLTIQRSTANSAQDVGRILRKIKDVCTWLVHIANTSFVGNATKTGQSICKKIVISTAVLQKSGKKIIRFWECYIFTTL